jgi:hypothetical protein
MAWWDAQDPDTALRYAREALALYRMTEDTRGLALAHVLNASLLNLERDWRKAARHLAKADFILTATGASPQERGVLRAEQAKVAAWSGDGETALRLAREADELLRDEHMQDGCRRTRVLLASLSSGAASSRDRAKSLTQKRQGRHSSRSCIPTRIA